MELEQERELEQEQELDWERELELERQLEQERELEQGLEQELEREQITNNINYYFTIKNYYSIMNSEKIKKLRKNLKLLQKEFAEKIGVTSGYVSQLELGVKPISETIKRSLLLLEENDKLKTELHSLKTTIKLLKKYESDKKTK